MMRDIYEEVGEPAALELVAEEAAELAQACLKLSRILRGENPTPVPEVLAAEKAMEEAAEDVVPAAKGKWKRISPPDNDGNAIYRCSKCQHQDIHAIGCEVPYCWYCGTRMEGEQDAELDRRDSETSRKT